MEEYRVDYVGRADAWERTPQGGILAKGNLTRTGVLVYRNPDGSTRRELRHPDEVFSADSLRSLRGAPVTLRHPATPVTAETWGTLAIGHVGEDVRADERFVLADSIRIQRADAAAQVMAGALKEFSCGYHCQIDPTPGEYQGERYDAVQRDIRYNHVALGPSGWGRAGADVAIRADGAEGESYPSDAMTPEEKQRLDAAEAALAAERKRNDELQGRLDSLQARADAAENRQPDEAVIEARVQARLALRSDAAEVLGADKVPAGSDRDVKIACIRSDSPEFDATNRSDDYINARFDALVEGKRKARSANGAVRQDAHASAGAGPKDTAGEARARMIARLDGKAK